MHNLRLEVHFLKRNGPFPPRSLIHLLPVDGLFVVEWALWDGWECGAFHGRIVVIGNILAPFVGSLFYGFRGIRVDSVCHRSSFAGPSASVTVILPPWNTPV